MAPSLREGDVLKVHLPICLLNSVESKEKLLSSTKDLICSFLDCSASMRLHGSHGFICLANYQDAGEVILVFLAGDEFFVDEQLSEELQEYLREAVFDFMRMTGEDDVSIESCGEITVSLLNQ